MSEFKLYSSNLSPYGSMVRAVLEFTGADYEFIYTHPFIDGKTEEFLTKLNHKGKVPVLVHGDLILTESVAICRYLATIAERKDFYPYDDPAKLAKINALIDYEMTFVRDQMGLFSDEVFYGPLLFKDRDDPTEEKLKELQETFSKGCGYIKKSIDQSGGPYLNGENLSLADFTLFFYLLNDIHTCGADYQEVAEWHDKVAEEPAVQRVLEFHRIAKEEAYSPSPSLLPLTHPTNLSRPPILHHLPPLKNAQLGIPLPSPTLNHLLPPTKPYLQDNPNQPPIFLRPPHPACPLNLIDIGITADHKTLLVASKPDINHPQHSHQIDPVNHLPRTFAS